MERKALELHSRAKKEAMLSQGPVDPRPLVNLSTGTIT